MANVGKIELELAKRASTATPSDLHSYAKAIEKLQLGEVCGVFDTIGDLPDPATVNPACLYLVLSDEILYVVRDGAWQALNPPPPPLSELWAWGVDNVGYFGTGTVSYNYSPIVAAGGSGDWASFSMSGYSNSDFTVAIKKNGTMWSWGENAQGQLGVGDNIDRKTPTQVLPGTTWCTVSTRYATVAVKSDGTLWGWGDSLWSANGSLQAAGDRSSPIQIPNSSGTWVEVSVGSCFSLGKKSDNTLWAWGTCSFGALASCVVSTTQYTISPLEVCGGFADWVTIAAGGQHALGIRGSNGSGSLWAWGRDVCGVLGKNTNSFHTSSPVQVCGGFSDWCKVSAGNMNSAGIRTNGTLWAWGANYRGELGDGTTIYRSSPVQVTGGFTDWCDVKISAVRRNIVGVRTNGTLWGWGDTFGGIITTRRSSPVQIDCNLGWITHAGIASSHLQVLRCY